MRDIPVGLLFYSSPAPHIGHCTPLNYLFCRLKVSKNQNDFMKTPLGQKSNVIIVRIYALLYSRAEILTIIMLLFGPISVFMELIQFLLTFSRDTGTGQDSGLTSTYKIKKIFYFYKPGFHLCNFL